MTRVKQRVSRWILSQDLCVGDVILSGGPALEVLSRPEEYTQVRCGYNWMGVRIRARELDTDKESTVTFSYESGVRIRA
jgi:hypothetical protein